MAGSAPLRRGPSPPKRPVTHQAPDVGLQGAEGDLVRLRALTRGGQLETSQPLLQTARCFEHKQQQVVDV